MVRFVPSSQRRPSGYGSTKVYGALPKQRSKFLRSFYYTPVVGRICKIYKINGVFYRGGIHDVLDCGHTLPVYDVWEKRAKRVCKECPKGDRLQLTLF